MQRKKRCGVWRIELKLLTERIGVEGDSMRRKREETIAGEQRRTVMAT